MPECPTCGKELGTELGVKQHHTKVHGESIAGVEKICEICGETYTVSPSEEHSSRCCSKECKYKLQSKEMSGQNHPNWEGGKPEFTCKQCGSKYEKYADNSTFCSSQCQYQWRSENLVGEDCPFYNGGMVETECKQCGDEYEKKQSHVEDSSFCSMNCLSSWRSENIVGEKHPNWKGGHTEYRGENWNNQRRKAIERDGECMFCGMSMKEHTMIYGSELEVHHVTPWRISESNDLSNLITLCKACHLRCEGKTHRENRNT